MEGGAVVAPNGGSVTLAQVARTYYRAPQNLPPDMHPGGLEVTQGHRPVRDTGTFSYACHAAVVEVDTATGIVSLLDYVIAEDGGTLLNPMIVDGQVLGGAAQGHRHRALRGDALRRAGPAAGGDPGRLPAARLHRGAGHRARAHGDALADQPLRPEGHRRERRHRPASRHRQRDERRAGRSRRGGDGAADHAGAACWRRCTHEARRLRLYARRDAGRCRRRPAPSPAGSRSGRC